MSFFCCTYRHNTSSLCTHTYVCVLTDLPFVLLPFWFTWCVKDCYVFMLIRTYARNLIKRMSWEKVDMCEVEKGYKDNTYKLIEDLHIMWCYTCRPFFPVSFKVYKNNFLRSFITRTQKTLKYRTLIGESMVYGTTRTMAHCVHAERRQNCN